MANWDQVLIDRFGNALGELTEAAGRTVKIPLNGLASGAFVLDTKDPLANACRGADLVMVKSYRDGTLMGVGPVAPNYNKVVSESSKTIAVNWAGAGWRLTRRIIESSKSKSGISYGTPAAFIDRGTIAQTFINELNTNSDTGIRIGTISPSSGTAVGPWYYKNAMEAIQDLSGTLDGFDWRITPREPAVDALGLALGNFNCSAAIGGLATQAIFEYGDGRYNVASFTETGDVSGIMNRGYILPPGFPDNATQDVLTYTDPNRAAGRPIYEDVVQSDLVVDDMRQKLITEHVTVRKQPRMVITFEPTVDAQTGVMPQYGIDYSEGDIVQFRAVEFGSETVNALFRMYAVNFNIDDNGNETATPVLLSQ